MSHHEYQKKRAPSATPEEDVESDDEERYRQDEMEDSYAGEGSGVAVVPPPPVDAFFSVIARENLSEAQEFRAKGHNSQRPAVNPALLSQLQEAIAVVKLRLYQAKKEDWSWLGHQITQLNRFITQLSESRLQTWVDNALRLSTDEDGGTEKLKGRDAAQSLVRRLELALQALLRVVTALGALIDYSSEENLRRAAEEELTGEASNAITPNNAGRTVAEALEAMKGERSWSALVDARVVAKTADKAAFFDTVITATRRAAEKANKNARTLSAEVQPFFSQLAAYLQTFSGTLSKTHKGPVSDAPSAPETASAGEASDDKGSLRQRIGKKVEEGKSQVALLGMLTAQKVNSVKSTLWSNNTSDDVRVNSLIRSILWRWQQPAIKMQFASRAIAVKAEAFKHIAGTLDDQRHPQEATVGDESASFVQDEADSDTQVRAWVQAQTEQEKPENKTAAKLSVLNQLFASDIAHARKLVTRFSGRGDTEQSIKAEIHRQFSHIMQDMLNNQFDAAHLFQRIAGKLNKFLPDIVEELATSVRALHDILALAERPVRDFSAIRELAKTASSLATQVKEQLKAKSSSLTGKPLDDNSLGARLAKHWANLAKENGVDHWPMFDAGSVLAALRKQGLLAGTVSTGDPEGYLLATRLAGELENARHDELMLPMSPDEYVDLEKNLIEFIVRWGQRRTSRGAARLVVELCFEQAIDTLAFSLSNVIRIPYKVLKASIMIPYKVNKIKQYTMPGQDKPYKAIYGLLGKKLGQLGFKLLITPVPGVVKFVAGGGITAAASGYNRQVKSGENTVSAVYERVAEGKKSRAIKMDSWKKSAFDTVLDAGFIAGAKGVNRAWQSGASRAGGSQIPGERDEASALTASEGEQEQDVITPPSGGRFLISGPRAHREEVHRHLAELEKHPSGRALLATLQGREITLLPPHPEDLLRTEQDENGENRYFGSRTMGDVVYFDPHNHFYGRNRADDVEAWRDVDPSMVLFHELLHIATGERGHQNLVPSAPDSLDENDYRQDFYRYHRQEMIARTFTKEECDSDRDHEIAQYDPNLHKNMRNSSVPQEDNKTISDIDKHTRTMENIGDSILNYPKQVREILAEKIKKHNTGRPKSEHVHVDTMVNVRLYSKTDIAVNQRSAGPGKKTVDLYQLTPFKTTKLPLYVILSGEYKHNLDKLTNNKLGDYHVSFGDFTGQLEKRDDGIRMLIGSVSRDELESQLKRRLNDYFNKPDNAKKISDIIDRKVRLTIIKLLNSNTFPSYISNKLKDFYDGKVFAQDIYIKGVRVPGVFAIPLGGKRRLVLNIYTNETFIINDFHFTSGAGWYKKNNIRYSEAGREWNRFERMVMTALPVYEQRRYANQKRPFEENDIMEFRGGSNIKDYPGVAMNDIKNKQLKDIDTHIYSNTEQNTDLAMRLAKIATVRLSPLAGAASGGYGFLLALGIDSAYATARYVQSNMTDNPAESDDIKSEVLVDTVFLAGGAVADTADSAVKGFRALKQRITGIVNARKKTRSNIPRAKTNAKPSVESPDNDNIDEAFSAYAKEQNTKLPDAPPPSFERPKSKKILQTGYGGRRTVVKSTYNDVTLISPENSQARTLVVNAHGGYDPNVKNPFNMIYFDDYFIPRRAPKPSPAITVPDNLTVEFMGPHRHVIYSKGKEKGAPTNFNPVKEELNNAVQVGPFATVNNQNGTHIHNNSNPRSMHNALSQGHGKAATGISDAKQNENNTLVRDYTYTQFLPKEPTAHKPSPAELNRRAESYNRQTADFVMESHYQASQGRGVNSAADVLVINEGKEVTLKSLLDTVNTNPDFKEYDRVIIVACRAPSTGDHKKYRYSGTEKTRSNAKGPEPAITTSNNGHILMHLVYQRNATNGKLELEEVRELDNEPTQIERDDNTNFNPDDMIDDMIKTDRTISDIVDNPRERSEETLRPVANYIQAHGFSNVRYRRVDIQVHDASNNSTIFTDTLVVVGKKNGKDYVFDLAAGQHYHYGYSTLDEPLILPHNEWDKAYGDSAEENRIINISYTDYKTAEEAIGKSRQKR